VLQIANVRAPAERAHVRPDADAAAHPRPRSVVPAPATDVTTTNTGTAATDTTTTTTATTYTDTATTHTDTDTATTDTDTDTATTDTDTDAATTDTDTFTAGAGATMIHAASTSYGHAGPAAPSSAYTNTPMSMTVSMAMRPDSPRPGDVFHFQGFAAAYAYASAPPTGGGGGFVDSYPHMSGIAAATPHHGSHSHSHVHSHRPHAADLATIQEDSTPAGDHGARSFGQHIAHSPSKAGSPFTHRRSIGRKRTMKRHIKATIGKIPLWEAAEAHGHAHGHHGHSMCASG